ncbi:hypothetical protein [Streptomyces sp. NPDC056672]|uniref:hypothetical protein n=1 Tax=Streptomyces sp. NPDC056672 TaxID=3345906 RepID=UPI00367923F0
MYVPSLADTEELAAVVARKDLPGYGELRPGLKDVAEGLEELAHLVGKVTAGYMSRGSGPESSLWVEMELITHAAARVGRLADEMEAPRDDRRGVWDAPGTGEVAVRSPAAAAVLAALEYGAEEELHPSRAHKTRTGRARDREMWRGTAVMPYPVPVVTSVSQPSPSIAYRYMVTIRVGSVEDGVARVPSVIRRPPGPSARRALPS